MNNRLLNINILDHPSNRNTLVIFYTEKRHSDYFKQLLKENDISYEFQIDEEEDRYYFGINKPDQKVARKLNFLVFAKYRKPFINSKAGRFLLVGITLLFIILAFIGYIINSPASH